MNESFGMSLPVEGGGEVGGEPEGVHSDPHLEHEQTQENKLSVNWTRRVITWTVFNIFPFKRMGTLLKVQKNIMIS